MEDFTKPKTVKETTPKKEKKAKKKDNPSSLIETTNKFEKLKEMDVDAKLGNKPKYGKLCLIKSYREI